jgi:hypothetical protein
VIDSDGNALRRGTMEAVRGVNTLRWDLMLDPELALPVEQARVAENEDVKPADTPWAEVVRLERQLYVTPGTYTIRIEADGDSGETELKVNAPRPRQPRVQPEPRIRGQRRR